MTIAVVFALEAEFAPWRRRHDFQKTVGDGHPLYHARIGQTLVRVVLSGIAVPNRTVLAGAFADPLDLAIVAGISGSLKPAFGAGDILVARRVDTHAAGWRGLRAGEEPALSTGRDTSSNPGETIAIDGRLVNQASMCGATIVDTFLTVDRLVRRAEEKVQLGRRADAIDMESFMVIRESKARGVPGLAIRVVGDTATEDLPLDFAAATRPDGSISTPRVLADAFRRPDRWPMLVGFAASQKRALNGLASFLDRFIASLDPKK